MILLGGLACLLLVVLAGVGIYFSVTEFPFLFEDNSINVVVDSSKELYSVDEKFLSVALDTSFMRCLFHKLTEREWETVTELSTLLSPAYLRLGGTEADCVVFKENDNSPKKVPPKCEDGVDTDPLIISGQDWLKINNFARKAGLSFIFDLNVLLRSGSKWNSSNAKTLIKFSEQNGFPMDFQLGNEPNSFLHVFNVSISGHQLAKDFHQLKGILNASEAYKGSKLIGPDVTRPKQIQGSSLKFLKDFLASSIDVDAVSWHQYYLNGRTATLDDFLNPEVFDELPEQIKLINETVQEFSSDIPIWISETSSAYGGGARGLSDRYAGSFLWLDKLGVAAKSGISVVIRQSLIKDYYALISPYFTPSSDFWVSFFYKNFVGNKVLKTEVRDSQEKAKYLRLYSHCLASNSPVKGTLVMFGMNLSNITETVVPTGIDIDYPVHSFTFVAENFVLKSRTVWLNDKPLVYNPKTIHDVLKNSNTVKLPLVAPPYSIFFWIFQEIKDSVCTDTNKAQAK